LNSSQLPQPCQCQMCQNYLAALRNPAPQPLPRFGPLHQSEYAGAGDVPLVPGTLRVFRSWFVNADGWLEAMNFPAVWGPGLNVAHCMGSGGVGRNVTPMSRVPDPACTCGFYGTYKPPSFISPLHLNAIHGVVQVSGRVILGTKGVRAQKARIVAVVALESSLFYVDPQRVALTRQHYPDVKWFNSLLEIVQAFPPQDVSELIGKPELPEMITVTTPDGVSFRVPRGEWRIVNP
jgi:hypothetical protein